MNAKTIARKLARIRAGSAPRALDLFSGCGGLSLGLQAAGCEPIAGLDSDIPSVESWYYNLRRGYVRTLTGRPAWDIRSLPYGQFLREVGAAEMVTEIDIVCGGPPCQAYSRIGKAKLKSLGGDEADLKDDRGSLFQEFLRYVEGIVPVAVLMENVPDSCNYGGVCIPEEVCAALEEMGYRAGWTLLDAAEYGVPQFRQRVIVSAIHRYAEVDPTFPLPTHKIPDGVKARWARGRVDGLFERALDGECPHYLRPPVVDAMAPPVINVTDALSDLPRIAPLLVPRGSSISQDVNVLQPYSSNPRHAYQLEMRGWPGFSTSGWVTGNSIRNTARDFRTFALMKEGDQYPEAHALACRRAEAAVEEERKRLGRAVSSSELAKILANIVPPYSLDKFESKWSKLSRDRPSHTVLAHLQFDTYSHIHYDSSQARGISVREAARLQSFPDGFRFMGSMCDAFRQIGNAVPPLLARALGCAVLQALRARTSRTNQYAA